MSRFSSRLFGVLPVSQWLSVRGTTIRSVQRGTIAIAPASASNTATITSVTVAHSRLRLLGYGISAASTNDKLSARIVFTNATTITAVVNTATDVTVTVSFEVVEYWPGVVRSIQRGTVAGNTTATIGAVRTETSEVDWLGGSGSDANTNITTVGRVTLTNATTVTGTSAGGANDTIGFQVVEWV